MARAYSLPRSIGKPDDLSIGVTDPRELTIGANGAREYATWQPGRVERQRFYPEGLNSSVLVSHSAVAREMG